MPKVCSHVWLSMVYTNVNTTCGNFLSKKMIFLSQTKQHPHGIQLSCMAWQTPRECITSLTSSCDMYLLWQQLLEFYQAIFYGNLIIIWNKLKVKLIEYEMSSKSTLWKSNHVSRIKDKNKIDVLREKLHTIHLCALWLVQFNPFIIIIKEHRWFKIDGQCPFTTFSLYL